MDTKDSRGGAIGGAPRARRRRRTYTLEMKRQVVAESFEPGVSVAEVARRHDMNANLVFNWRRQALEPAVSADMRLIPVELIETVSEPLTPSLALHDMTSRSAAPIEIVLADGVRVRVGVDVDVAALKRVLTVLRAVS